MGAVYVDAAVEDDFRRDQLFAGELYVYSPNSGSAALCAVAREMAGEAFGEYDPPVAQDSMTAEEYAAILADLKPRFIHDPRCKQHIADMLSELGCDLEATYFDVPRLRTMAHGEFMKVGLALQFHPHRDTWFSAPYAQLNWWLPVYEIESDNAMAFHQRYFDAPVENSSSIYDYDEWTRTGRQQAAQQVKVETRKQPEALEELELDPQVRVVTPVGGVLIFSAAHLHSTVPNTTDRTRFSIDFRTVNVNDLVEHRGAPNVDAACSGTTLGDFVRASDLEPLPADLIESYRLARSGAV